MTLRVSNTVLFDVIEENTKTNVGWEVRVYDRDDPTVLLAVVPRWLSFSFSKVLGDTGAGSLELDMNDADVYFSDGIQDHLVNDENLIRFYRDGVPRFSFFNHDEVDEPVTADEDRPVSVTGRGPSSMLEWATVLPPEYPSYSALPWTWTSTPALSAWLDLKEEADGRGCPCLALEPTFTHTHDSAGEPWQDVNNMTLNPGGDLLALLRRFAEAGGSDWEVTPDLKLNAKQSFGFHRENTVRFWVGLDQLTAKKTKTRRGISNVVYTVSANEQVPFVTDPTSLADWGRREVLSEVSNAQDSVTAQHFGQIILDANKEEVFSATFKVLPDQPGRVVFQDYDVGDWVWISGEVGLEGVYRIVAIGFKVDENGYEDLEITVESALEIRLIQLQKQFERETGASMRIQTELQLGSRLGSGGGGELNDFGSSNIDLGTLEPLGTYTWFTITGVPKRALILRMRVTSGGSINWGLQIRSEPNGGGELMFEAVGIGSTEYNCSWPWVFKNTEDPAASQMHVGIRNISGAPSLFTIAELRGEVLSQ